MIATALTFVFGFLAATLIALVVSPLFWSRTRRLALREYQASIPASAREVRASLDHVRAEAALTARRREMKAEAEIEKAALARIEAGRLAGENAELRARNAALSGTLGDMSGELRDASEQLALRDEEIEELGAELRALSHDFDLKSDELEALDARFADLGAIADERRATIEEQDLRIEELSDALREAERERREAGKALERLRSEAGVLEAHLAKERNAVKRLDDKVARLTGQLAERDEQIARLLGEAASSAAAYSSDDHAEVEAAEAFRLDEGRNRQGEGRLQVRPAIRPAFGRRSDEAAAPASRHGETGREPAGKAVEEPEGDVAIAAEGPASPALSPQPAGPKDRPNANREPEPVPSLAMRLGLPERPEFADDLGDGELRDKVGELAAKVVALTAEREGARSPLDAILDAEATMAMPRRHDAAGPSLAERVRRLRQEARDHAAE
ncbi:hypothetical protein [Jiella pacifica]|uniref:Uncharacterized protein n=1 Tax=Jiella pacifica TaxID=2696469 RepID=A0A6N9T4E9_9HYPH|nr:hypothetical protein [Jiella pacifica]NDW06254.1 hypothetical protein [Jiella pacifica]